MPIIKKNQRPQSALRQKEAAELLRQIQLIVDNSYDAIIGETLDGIITSWNGGAERMFGYSAKEAIGKSALFLFPLEMKDEMAALLDKIKAGETIADYDSVRLCKDGSRISVSLSVSPIKLEDGTIIGASIVERDITARKKMEGELLLSSENRYKTLFTSSRDAVMTLEPPTWKFTSGNPSTLAMFGLKSEKEFTACEPWKLSPERQPDGRLSSEKAGEMIEKAMRDGNNFFEWTHRRTNGEDFFAEVLLSRVEHNEKIFLHAVVRDITERKKSEEKLKEYEEEKFKVVFDSANDGMVLVDTATKKFSLGNKAFCKLLGYGSEEIKSLALADIHTKEDLPYVMDKFEKQMKGELTVAADIPVKRKDGSIFYADINSSLITIGGKKLVLGIFRDITERKEAEMLQRESNEKFLMAFQTAPYAITITRPEDAKFIEVNDAFSAITGFTREEALSSSAIGLNLWADSEDRKQVLLALRGGAAIMNKEVRFRRKDGETIIGLFSAQIVHIGGKLFILSSINDVTEQKKAEQSVRDLNEVRSKFITIISHQLRTPLTAVNWNLEMILNGQFGKLEETQHKFMEVTYSASVEITRRINNLLMAMDIEEGRITYETGEVIINNLCAGVVNETAKKRELKNISCMYVPPTADLPAIAGDGEKLRLVIAALVENAIAYTKNDGEIAISLQSEDGTVRFEISDNGIGIPQAEQHLLFTRFFRASNASVMQTDAFGLGLFIAKSVIEQHHGQIGFESKEGKGSTFWFEIPLKKGATL